jgi:hypothetical protein
MVIARIRTGKDTDKVITNRQFSDLKVAQDFCNSIIGDYSDSYGTVEFILLTDYATGLSEEYGIEDGGK